MFNWKAKKNNGKQVFDLVEGHNISKRTLSDLKENPNGEKEFVELIKTQIKDGYASNVPEFLKFATISQMNCKDYHGKSLLSILKETGNVSIWNFLTFYAFI